MKFISKCCAKSNLPVLMDAVWGKLAPRLTHVVVLTPDGGRVIGAYDGQGMQVEDYASAKFVLEAFYDGETFEQLPGSGDDPEKGYHHDREFVQALETIAGFRTYIEYYDTARDYHDGLYGRVKAGFEVLNLRIPSEHVFSVYSMLEMAGVKYPPSMETLRRERPEAVPYLPQTFEELRAATLKFDEAFRARGKQQAEELVRLFGKALP